MKIKIELLKANPFKIYINDGKLNNDRIEIFKESIEHGTLPEIFIARKHDGFYEISFGHHRLQALKEVKGGDYEVDVNVVKFSDEQMLIDMVRENITQRDTDFHDTKQSIMLARGWLQSKVPTVKQFHNRLKDGTLQGSEPQPNSYRSIANFLSKNGKAVSYGTVKNYLYIADKLNPEIEVKKQDQSTAETKEKKDDGSIGVRDAIKLSTITDDWEEQKDLVQALKNTREQHGNQKQVNLTAYKEASNEIKQKVRRGELDLADVKDAMIKNNIEEYNEKNPRYEFIPNFAGRLRQFDKDVHILEKQVRAFSMVFRDNRFNEKYTGLKHKQKKKLTQLIFDIKKRIKHCYDEVEYFIDILPDKELLEDKENEN